MDAPHKFMVTPEAASNFAPKVDALLYYLLGVTVFFTGLIFVLIVFFALKYRRKTAADMPPKSASPIWMEIGWMVGPLPLLLIMFYWGASLFAEMRTPPADAEEIHVQARRWMWTTQHANGSRQKNELTVPLGRPVKLVMSSEDVIHDFYVPAFRTKQDVLPDKYTTEWFTATKPGVYQMYCSEYCGADHSQMRGRIVVLEPAAYDAWLAGTAANEQPAVTGAKLFISEGCTQCHGQRGPTLFGVYGSMQPLDDGSSVLADESYLRESILVPAAKVVRGYPPGGMPSYRERLTEEQLQALVSYIKTLAGPPGAKPALPASSQPVAEPLSDPRLGNTQQ